MVTAGILGRFERRDRVLFDLEGWQKFLAFTGGMLVLLLCIAFNVYGWMISAS
jgi:hypothetical protein